MQNLLLITLLVISSLSLSSKQVVLGPSSDSQEEIQEALIVLEPGDVLTLKSGEYFFTAEESIIPGLSLLS